MWQLGICASWIRRAQGWFNFTSYRPPNQAVRSPRREGPNFPQVGSVRFPRREGGITLQQGVVY